MDELLIVCWENVGSFFFFPSLLLLLLLDTRARVCVSALFLLSNLNLQVDY